MRLRPSPSAAACRPPTRRALTRPSRPAARCAQPAAAAARPFSTPSRRPPCRAARRAARCVCEFDPLPFGAARGVLVYHQTDQPADVGKTGPNAQYFNGNKCAPPPSTTILAAQPHLRYPPLQGRPVGVPAHVEPPRRRPAIPWTDDLSSSITSIDSGCSRTTQRCTRRSSWARRTARRSSSASVGIRCAPMRRRRRGLLARRRYVDPTITGNHMGNHKFAALNNHCHAPTLPLDERVPLRQGLGARRLQRRHRRASSARPGPFTAAPAPASPARDSTSPAYIAIPDCFWGDARWGWSHRRT